MNKITALQDKDMDQSRDWFKLRILRKVEDKLEEVSRQRVDALNVDFYLAKSSGRPVASVHGVTPSDDDSIRYIISN